MAAAMVLTVALAVDGQSTGANAAPTPEALNLRPFLPEPVPQPAPDLPPPPPPSPVPNPGNNPGPQVCRTGPALAAAEALAIVQAAAQAVDDERMVIAVVDRAGNPLAVYRKANPRPGDEEVALGLARAAAFFSNDTAPLSSRTVRFVSGIHFPPGIANTPNAALYGIENTNRGCDLNVPFAPNQAIEPARSLRGIINDLPCRAGDVQGCSAGPVTGKASLAESAAEQRRVNPGGVPIFRFPAGPLVGGVGVAGIDPAAAEFAAFSAAFSGPFGLDLSLLGSPGVVFIDGVRLPFVNTLNPPPGVTPGNLNTLTPLFPATDGRCAPEGFLVTPRGSATLSAAEVTAIVNTARAAAGRTRALIRLPAGSRTRMVIAVGDLDGKILALFRMEDAPVFSIDVAVAKARNVVYFSTTPGADLPGVPPGTAVTNRTISFGAQPLYPPGIGVPGAVPPGPFFDLFQRDTANPCSQGFQPPKPNQNGVVFFPGAIPLYRGGTLVGGLGISGDGVEQDDYVSFEGAVGFQPPEALWADRVFVDGVRLPFLKFPRNPEG
jgi:uncharacterized protein GlcG (DUF336 family)